MHAAFRAVVDKEGPSALRKRIWWSFGAASNEAPRERACKGARETLHVVRLYSHTHASVVSLCPIHWRAKFP